MSKTDEPDAVELLLQQHRHIKDLIASVENASSLQTSRVVRGSAALPRERAMGSGDDLVTVPEPRSGKPEADDPDRRDELASVR